MNSEQVINLGGSFTVTQGNFNFYKELVEMVIQDLEHDRKYTLKKMFGNDFWEEFDENHRKLIGKCVARMVSKNLLPLQFTGSVKTKPKHYCLK